MKRLALCVIRVRRTDYMSAREYSVEESIKQVWVSPDEYASVVVERFYDALSDPYGTRWRVLWVEEVETIGSPE